MGARARPRHDRNPPLDDGRTRTSGWTLSDSDCTRRESRNSVVPNELNQLAFVLPDKLGRCLRICRQIRIRGESDAARRRRWAVFGKGAGTRLVPGYAPGPPRRQTPPHRARPHADPLARAEPFVELRPPSIAETDRPDLSRPRPPRQRSLRSHNQHAPQAHCASDTAGS